MAGPVRPSLAGHVGELRIEWQGGTLSALLRLDITRCHALREKRRRQSLQYGPSTDPHAPPYPVYAGNAGGLAAGERKGTAGEERRRYHQSRARQRGFRTCALLRVMP